MRRLLRLAVALTLVGAAVAALNVSAEAGGAQCAAHIGGVETGKKILPELVLFNTTGANMSLDLLIRDADGTELLNAPDSIVLGGLQTLAIDLSELLAQDLPPKTKPYQGLIAVTVTGNAPFGPDNVLVHIAQYFGKRRKPKAAFLIQPLYEDIDP